MKIASRNLKWGVTIFILALALIGAGCASSATNSAPADPPASGFKHAALKSTDRAEQAAMSRRQAPVPRVQECGIVAISSPPKYVCNGKLYTSMELAKIRNDEAKKYQSGE